MGLWVAIGVAALVMFAALADGDSGLRTWWELRGDLGQAQERVARLRADLSTLERDVGGLEGDPFAVERAIRERLEYAKPGETLIRLAPSKSANPRIP